MKVIFILSFLVLTNWAAYAGSFPAYAYVLSPDHPQTWVTGADEKNHQLYWDQEKKMLYLQVTYITYAPADFGDPPEEESYQLSFPDVRYNAKDESFSTLRRGHDIKLAYLKHTIVGPDITAAPAVELNVRCSHGLIFAAFIPKLRE